MKVCLHCGYRVPKDRLRTCPQCGQLLPVAETAVGRSQYVSGDLLKKSSGGQDLHPYLWGVESAEQAAAEAQRGGRSGEGPHSGGLGGATLVVALLLVLAVGTLGALYATGNAPWMPLLPH